MKNKIHFIPLLFFFINAVIYLIFHFTFKYDLNRKLYYEFHNSILTILAFVNVFVSVLFFVICYTKKMYDNMYYTLIPILIYIIFFIISIVIAFK